MAGFEQLLPGIHDAINQVGADGINLSSAGTSAVNYEMALKNMEIQREFAQHGIRWRAEDARAAGLSPVTALGANTTSFNPVHIGGGGGSDSIAPALANFGQNISRAVRATATRRTRQELEMNELHLENMKLQNGLLGQRIAALQNSQTGPPQPEERHAVPDITYTRTKTGGVAPIPSEGFADRAEDQWIPQIAWAARNQFLPPDPDTKPPKGTEWVWNPWRFEFHAVPKEKTGFGHRRSYFLNKFRKWIHKK